MPAKPLTFQGLILKLHEYWGAQGCAILQPYDVEVGAGTLSPMTVLRALGPKPWKAQKKSADHRARRLLLQAAPGGRREIGRAHV